MRRTLMLNKSERPPKHQHVHLKTVSRRTFKRLEIGIASSIRSFSFLHNSNDRETLALLTEANIFSRDLQKIVFNLQRLAIKSFVNGQCDYRLDAVAKSFSSFAYSVQQSYSEDAETIKNQLKDNLKNILPEARRLMQFVEQNTNYDYRHDVVTILDDILYSVQKIEFRNIQENCSPDNMITEIIKAKDEVSIKIQSFDQISPEVLRDIKFCIRSCYEKFISVIHLLDQAADNYSEEIRDAMLNISYNIMNDIGSLDSNIRSKSDVTSIKSSFIITACSVCLEIENVAELLKQEIDDEHVANNLHNLGVTSLVYGLAVRDQIVRRFEWICDYTNA